MRHSTVNLPNFVHDYLGRPVTMTKIGRFDWEFEGSRQILTVTGRTATQARENVAEAVARLDGRIDRRRRV